VECNVPDIFILQVNHFPGTFQIGRKDRLWRNMNRLQARIGKKNCNFVPQTYVLPPDLPLLKKIWEEGGKQKWILKPVSYNDLLVYKLADILFSLQPASARGIGIRVVNRWKDIPKKRAVIVQRSVSTRIFNKGCF
jgi:tubulin polyglutamylase TTLL4